MTDKKPMSPMGAALFAMCTDIGKSQARIYAEGELTPERIAEARKAAEMTALAHRPLVLQTIKRISR